MRISDPELAKALFLVSLTAPIYYLLRMKTRWKPLDGLLAGLLAVGTALLIVGVFDKIDDHFLAHPGAVETLLQRNELGPE